MPYMIKEMAENSNAWGSKIYFHVYPFILVTLQR
jgi:hypothetical protein